MLACAYWRQHGVAAAYQRENKHGVTGVSSVSENGGISVSAAWRHGSSVAQRKRKKRQRINSANGGVSASKSMAAEKRKVAWRHQWRRSGVRNKAARNGGMASMAIS